MATPSPSIRGWANLLGDLEREQSYYASRSMTGGVLDAIPSPWSDTPPQGFNETDLHNSTEGDILEHAILRVLRRGGVSQAPTTDVNFMENTAHYFKRTFIAIPTDIDNSWYYRDSYAYNQDLDVGSSGLWTHTGAPIERLPDHFYNVGLYMHYLLTGDTGSLTEANVLMDRVVSWYNDPDVITAADFGANGCFLARGFFRHWKGACWAWITTRNTTYRDLMNQLAGIALSTSPDTRHPTLRCWINMAEANVDATVRQQASPIHHGIAQSACYLTYLFTNDATIREQAREQLIALGDFWRDYGFHPTFGITGYRWVPDYPAAGQIYHYDIPSAGSPFPGFAYTQNGLDILTWASRITGDFSYMQRAEQAWFAIMGYKRGVSTTVADGRGSALGWSNTQLGDYLDGKFGDPNNAKHFFELEQANYYTFFLDQLLLRRNVDRTPYFDSTVLPATTFAYASPTIPANSDLGLASGELWNMTTLGSQAAKETGRTEAIRGNYGGNWFGEGDLYLFSGAHAGKAANDVSIYRVRSNIWRQEFKPQCPPGVAGVTNYAYERSGDGVTAVFTIPRAVFSAAYIVVTVDGVTKTQGTHYNVSGIPAGDPQAGPTTITFTGGNIPPVGTNNVDIMYAGSAGSPFGEAYYDGGGCSPLDTRGYPHAPHDYDRLKWDPITRTLFADMLMGAFRYATSDTFADRTWIQLANSPPAASSNELACLFDYDPTAGDGIIAMRTGSTKGLWRYNRSSDTWTQFSTGAEFPAIGNNEPYTVWCPAVQKHFFMAYNSATFDREYYWVTFPSDLNSAATFTQITTIPASASFQTTGFYWDEVAQKLVLMQWEKVAYAGGLKVATVDPLNGDAWSGELAYSGGGPDPSIQNDEQTVQGLGNFLAYDYVNNVAVITVANLQSPGQYVGGGNMQTWLYRQSVGEPEPPAGPARRFIALG